MLDFAKRVLKRRDSLVGLALVLVLVAIGVSAPFLAPYHNAYKPSAFYVAAPDAVPGWVRLLPGQSSLPPDVIVPSSYTLQAFKSNSAVEFWKVDSTQGGVQVNVTYSSSVGPSKIPVNVLGAFPVLNTGPGSEELSVMGDSTHPVYIYLTHTLYYNYSAAPMFYSQVAVDPVETKGAGVAVFLYVNSSKGMIPTALLANGAGESALASNPVYGSEYEDYFASTAAPLLPNGAWTSVYGLTTAASLMPFWYTNSTSISHSEPATSIIPGKGRYTLGEIIAVYPSGNYNVTLYQSDFKFMVFGKAYGLLGTDANGADFWSEFATGTTLALEIGFGSALIALAIGTLLGLIAGFLKGRVDSALIFVFDVLLLLPGLILLIDLDTTFTIAHIVPNKVELIVFLLGVLGWPGIARIIRSQALSVGSRTYVEAARTMGSRGLSIIRNHVLPHTAATIIALVTYIVPGLVLADAGLDFLGLGISSTPTWGNILAGLLNETTPTNGYLWWMFGPIGAAIILLSIGFYLIGTAIQEEFARSV